jgi:hypothetical protein
MDTRERALRSAATKAGLGVNEYLDRLNKGLKYCWRCQDWHPIPPVRLSVRAPRWEGRIW